MKKAVFAVTVAMLFSLHAPVFADTTGIQINEIMYNLKTGSDSGREWVEVYNNGATPVDLSNYRFFENDTNHKMTLKQGSAVVPAGGYAVIVEDYPKFQADWPGFSGVVFDSAFSLSNTGETLAIKDANLKIVDQYTYSSTLGGDGDGNSLQNINGDWMGESPTPGAPNKISPVVPKPATPVPGSVVKSKSTAEKAGAENIIPSVSNFTDIPATSNPGGATSGHTDNSYFLWAILIIFVGFSAGAIYSILKSRRNLAPGDDFDILGE